MNTSAKNSGHLDHPLWPNIFQYILVYFTKKWFIFIQGGRSWQPFDEGKNGHKKIRQARIYLFRDKCVVFARNCKFASLTQYNISCNSAFLAQETLFLTQKSTFWPKEFQKVHKSRQILISRQKNV